MTRKAGYALAALLWLNGAAAEDGLLSEEAYFAEMPRVLTASRIAQSPLDAPAPVTVIDRETIRASGFTEIQDIFRLVPGFLVADWPEGAPLVVNHGLGDARSRRLQVLVDGRSVFDPFNGGVDWPSLPIRLEDVDRIEVVRAPNQASYGANAFQGVINIITRVPGLDPGGDLVVSRGKNGFEDYYARIGGGSDGLDWRISASTRAFTPFRDRQRPMEHWQEALDRQSVNAHVSYRPSLNEEWRAQLGLSQGSDRVGTSNVSSITPHHDYDTGARFLQLAWHRQYAPDSELSLQYYHYSRREREEYRVYPFYPDKSPVPYIDVNLDVDVRRDDLEFQQVHGFSDTLKGVWGIGLRRDAAESDHYLYGQGTVSGTQWQVFGNLDWQASPRWLLHFGGMLEKHYYTDALFSPRLAANYAITPEHSLRLSAGRGYRAPTIREMHEREVFTAPGGGIADINMWAWVDLKPETVNFQEIGYVGLFPGLSLQVDARVFVEHYDNYIDDVSCRIEKNECPFQPLPGYYRPPGFDPVSGLGQFGSAKAFYYYNSDNLRVTGADISLDWRNPRWGRFQFAHAITHIRAGGETDPDSELSAPLNATSLLWSKTFPGRVDASLGLYRVGYMMWPNDGDVQPNYTRVDMRLAKRFGRTGSENEVALTLQNLNSRHTEFDDYRVERQAFATLRLSW